MTAETADKLPSAVYRAYDSHGALLYIGRSTDPPRRFRSHTAEKEWWRKHVAFVSITWHPDIQTAKAIEVAAILKEAPPHNYVHTPRFSERLREGYAALRAHAPTPSD